MKEKIFSLTGLMILCLTAFSQEKTYIKNPAIGIHFFFDDFKTAANIKATSLSTVLRENAFGKAKDMAPGLSISYLDGLSEHLDFSATLGGSFLNYPIDGKSSNGAESFLLEADASVHAKMFSDQYVVVPFLSIGTGFSKYKGYFGAFIPVGVGLQVNFFDDAFLMINSQYRLKVSEVTNNHFFYSIGIAGNIGVNKNR